VILGIACYWPTIQRRTNSKAFRVVGDPQAKMSTATGGMGCSTVRFSPEADVVIIGENPETDSTFDVTEYTLGHEDPF
jgi:hypothetical protein